MGWTVPALSVFTFAGRSPPTCSLGLSTEHCSPSTPCSQGLSCRQQALLSPASFLLRLLLAAAGAPPPGPARAPGWAMLSFTFTTANPGQPNVISALLKYIGENCGIPSAVPTQRQERMQPHRTHTEKSCKTPGQRAVGQGQSQDIHF